LKKKVYERESLKKALEGKFSKSFQSQNKKKVLKIQVSQVETSKSIVTTKVKKTSNLESKLIALTKLNHEEQMATHAPPSRESKRKEIGISILCNLLEHYLSISIFTKGSIRKCCKRFNLLKVQSPRNLTKNYIYLLLKFHKLFFN
jgi:hypothetical protein